MAQEGNVSFNESEIYSSLNNDAYRDLFRSVTNIYKLAVQHFDWFSHIQKHHIRTNYCGSMEMLLTFMKTSRVGYAPDVTKCYVDRVFYSHMTKTPPLDERDIFELVLTRKFIDYMLPLNDENVERVYTLISQVGTPDVRNEILPDIDWPHLPPFVFFDMNG